MLSALKQACLLRRAYCLSGNRLLKSNGDRSIPSTTDAHQIYLPRTVQDIADLLRSMPASIAIACVGGGHESSNAAMFASREAIVLDLVRLKSIVFHKEGETHLLRWEQGWYFVSLLRASRVSKVPCRRELVRMLASWATSLTVD